MNMYTKEDTRIEDKITVAAKKEPRLFPADC
jgi:hypothetical protein